MDANTNRFVTDNGVVIFEIKETIFCGRSKGPAYISPNGTLHYMKESLLHRTDGPALVYPTANFHEYWVENTQLDPLEFFLKYGSVK